MRTNQHLTSFQKRLLNDKETLWQIVKIWHPDIPLLTKTNKGLVDTKTKVLAYWHYTWVSISFNLRDWGRVDINITNDDEYKHTLWGPKVSRKDMENALSTGLVRMKAWRSSIDKKFEKNYLAIRADKPNALEELRKQNSEEERTVKLLESKGYKLITVNEWYRDYYSD